MAILRKCVAILREVRDKFEGCVTILRGRVPILMVVRDNFIILLTFKIFRNFFFVCNRI